MNKIVNLIEVILVIIIVFVSVISISDKFIICTDLEVKQVKSETLKKEDESKEIIDDKEDVSLGSEVEDVIIAEEKQVDEVSKQEVLVGAINNYEVLEKQEGKLSAYGPNCIGCSGYLSSGDYVGDGNIYYQDPTYGTVRIVAGDRKYKLGSIVRIKSSKIEEDILAIVLDRGGAIGLDKKFMFDLLFESENEASNFGTLSNVVFEILRYGY